MTFMFATGIENSIPLIGSGTHRVDQYEKCGHYRHWKQDFASVVESGIPFLRYGAPLHTTHVGAGKYDWSFADETFTELRRLGITPIMDLCHFGLPSWLGDFQNPDWPIHFGEYAKAFATRYPWIKHYTPVNEMFVCSMFSAYYGWWNEQKSDFTSLVMASKTIAKANILAMQAILSVRPDALFIQAESMEFFHPESPEAIPHCDLMNEIRFLCLDLSYGKMLSEPLHKFTTEHGMDDTDRRWFVEQGRTLPRENCILGIDYYITNERYVRGDGSSYSSGDILGLASVAKQYHDRYGLPMMHSETNMADNDTGASAAWLRKQWTGLMGLRASGVPVVGFTWFSLGDQVDWCSALRENAGRVNAVGLFDMDRKIRPAGTTYRDLIGAWSPVLNS
jgi:beta-glucosidase